METLSKLGRQAEIPSVYDEMVCRFGEDNTPFIRKYLAKALCEKAYYFTQLAKKENSFAAYALTLYDELLQKFGNDTDTIIKQEVAWAMRNKSNALFTLERYDDAIKACDACIQKFSNETDTEIKQQVAIAMLGKGVALSNLNRIDDAIKACDACIQKFGNETDTTIKQKVAKAMKNKGVTLSILKRYDDAIKACDACIQKFGNETDTTIKQTVAKAMFEKGAALSNLKRDDDAIEVYDALIEKFSNETDIAIKREIVRDVVFRMLTYITNGDFGKKFYDVKDNNFFLHAKKTCDRLLKKFSNKNDIKTKKMLVIVRLIFYAQEVGWYDYELNKAYRHLSLAKDEAIKQWILPAIITEQGEFLRFSQSSDLGKFLEELYQSV
ncbi:MAG: tetratricopeptide repeat protein [Acetobacter sp.]|nr:tetratricopeptide repeat protein [Acetobacter sp.]